MGTLPVHKNNTRKFIPDRDLPGGGNHLLIGWCKIWLRDARGKFPFTPLARILGLVPLPIAYYGWGFLIIFLYSVSAEAVKRFFLNWCR